VAWYRATTGDPVVGPSALEWSVPAMRAATQRLALLDRSDRTAALAAVSDAVWAVTIVDAAMVRYHPDAYEQVLATSADRRSIEESLAGLRFVRNQIHDDAMLAKFVEPDEPGRAAGSFGVRGWTWTSVARPPLPPRGSRANVWETARHRAYEAQLAGHPVGEVFTRAEAFLARTAAEATAITDIGV
jgi:hypothetical protein